MSSFDVLEQSQESSRPIEVYVIAIGSTTYRYAAGEDDLTVDGDDFEAQVISRNEIVQIAEGPRQTVTLTLPGDNEFAERYIGVVPAEKATVSIIRLQRDESPTFDTAVLLFKGQVLSVQYSDDGATASVAVRSIESALSREIPRWTYMGMCNHILYDSTSGCNADPDDPQFKLTGAVTAVSGSVITVSGASSKPDGWWAGGFVRPLAGTEPRLVLAHTGDDLFLLLPFSGSILGADVVVQAGCNHILTQDCSTKFDRAIDFGGFAFTPLRNPFGPGGVA